jgi:hypothetical protein
MKRHLLIPVLFAVALGSLGVGAGEKDKKEKVKKADDIVVNGELIKADLKDKVVVNGFCKTFTFKMEKDKAYQIELQSQNFRPYLRLEDSAGKQVAADFDRLGNQSAVIVHRPAKTEDYTIITTTLNVNAVGKFTLTVKELTGDEGKPIELKIEKGVATHQGNLTKLDPKYMGKIHKLFIIQLEKDATYQIDHIFKGFDAYLYLENSDGKVLAQDDDGGEGLNSRITHKATASGKYRVVATSLGGSSVGAFTFSIRQTGGEVKKEEPKKD